MRRHVSFALVFALLAGPTGGVQAQAGKPAASQTLDRKKAPVPGPVPDFRVPAWTTGKLANGAELIVAERRGLPLVSFNITFIGGTNQFETPDKLGVGAFTTAMLREGTQGRDANALALALQRLGTNVNASVGDESGSMGFQSTTEKFVPTLEILADMLLNPTFPAPALERLRGQRLIALQQQNAQPGVIGSRVFSRVLYGQAHPYGQYPVEGTIKAVTRDDVAAFHKAYFLPGRAFVTVSGDIDMATARAAIDKALSGWSGGGGKPAFTYPAIPQARATAIYLVDKAGAKQSVVNIGLPGPPRSTSDYFALQVMNFILGGHFLSRLNANIREEKGYSYGVSSGFSYGKGPGPFSAGGDVVTEKTDAALQEFMKELRGILGARPISDDEMKMAHDSLIQRLPNQFASIGGIGAAITSLYTNDLPKDYYQTYAKNIRAVTKEDVLRVAKKYLDLERLNIVIVGDRKSIEGPLKAANIAPIVLLDEHGNVKQ